MGNSSALQINVTPVLPLGAIKARKRNIFERGFSLDAGGSLKKLAFSIAERVFANSKFRFGSIPGKN